MNRRPIPLSESPWFWVALFSGGALAALVALQPKYGRRQAQIERKYQARQYSTVTPPSTSAVTDSAEFPPRKYSTERHTIIRLGPLRIALLALAVVSLLIVGWQRSTTGREQNSARNW